MTIALGENSRMTVLPPDRDRRQRFSRDVLACRVITKPKAFDLVQVSSNSLDRLVYDASAFNAPALLKSIWLAIRADQPVALGQRFSNSTPRT